MAEQLRIEFIEERLVEAAAAVFMTAGFMWQGGSFFFGIGPLGGVAGGAGVIPHADAHILYPWVITHILKRNRSGGKFPQITLATST